MRFFSSDVYNSHNLWSCQKDCDALFEQTSGIPMGTYCAPLVADLFIFCYERDFKKFLSRENQPDIIEAFNSASRHLNNLNIDNIYFDQIVDRRTTIK